MKQLTEQTLKDLIHQVYLEAFKDVCAEEDLSEEEPALLAEPQFEGDEPPELSEGSSTPFSRLIKILNTFDEDERARLFRRYGYYTSAHLLNQLNNIKKAEKGAL